MTLRKSLLLAGASALILYPAAAGAQEGYSTGMPFPSYGLSGDETVSVEVGGAASTADSFKFGEYTGLEEENFYVIGNVDALVRDDYEDDDAFYLDLSARNLGLESRELDLELGAQGRYGARFHYQEIPHYLIDGALTPYRGEGTDSLSLPAGYPNVGDAGAPTSPTGILGVAGTLREIEIENQRERVGAGLFWSPLENLRVDVDYRNEVRKGTKTTYGIFGTNGGNMRSVALPDPVDYEVDEIDATANYSLGDLQLQAAYNASFFNDRNKSLTWDNAYTGSTWDDTPDEGRMSMNPDNQAHSFSLSGGYSILPMLRLTGSLGYGVMLQDEDFLPYTNNPDLAPATALPRDSLDGEVQTLRADLGVTARPIRNLDLSARYRFHDRDNKTAQEDYARVRNDVGAQDPATELRTNLPRSYTQHLANLEAGYRVLPGTKVSLNYEFERMERTFTERNETTDHEIGGKVRSQPIEMLSGWLSYAHSWRDGADYDGEATYFDSHPLETDPTAFENIPDTRKYYLADRDRDEVKGAVTVTPLDALAFTLSGSYALDDYDKTEIGLTKGELLSTTLDASFSPLEGLTTYAFFTFDQLTYDQNGLEWQGFAPSQINDPTRRWSTESQDRAHTIGIGATWAVIPGRLDLTADGVYSWSKTKYDFDYGSSTTFSTTRPLPDLKSEFRSLQVAADYTLLENVSLRLGYRYEFRDTQDFALDGVDPDESSNTLLFANPAPDYTAHIVAVSTRISF